MLFILFPCFSYTFTLQPLTKPHFFAIFRGSLYHKQVPESPPTTELPMSFLLLLASLASAHDLEVASGQAAFMLHQTATSTDFLGFTTYYETVVCPAYLQAGIGLTVEDAGPKALYVVITVPSTRGGFSTMIVVDEGIDGDIDTINTLKVSEETSPGVPLDAFEEVLDCYLKMAKMGGPLPPYSADNPRPALPNMDRPVRP